MYEMLIHVESADDMAIIVQACKGTAKLISSKLIDEPKSKKRRHTQSRLFKRSNTPRIGTITGLNLARQIFSDGKPHKTTEISSIFTQKGFKPKSVSPVLSILHGKLGELHQIAQGEYARTTKLKDFNSGGTHK